MKIGQNRRHDGIIVLRLFLAALLALWGGVTLAAVAPPANPSNLVDAQGNAANSAVPVTKVAVQPVPVVGPVAQPLLTPVAKDDPYKSYALIGLGAALALFLAGSGWLALRLMDKLSTIDADPAQKASLATLPLGMPEGSIRALLSIFVIVFGFAIVVLQKTLGLDGAEAITGFIGAVIAFYFSSRTEQAVRENTEKAMSAQANAEKAVTQANETRDQLQATRREMQETVTTVTAAVTAAATAPGGQTAEQVDARKQLETAQGDLGQLQNALTIIAGLKAGPELFEDAPELLAKVKQGLDTIAPILAGNTDAATLSRTATDMSAFVKEVLPREPILSTIFDVLSQVTAAAGAVQSGNASGITTALSTIAPLVGLAGGPVAVVGGIVASGIGLVSDAIRFDRMKAALTERPFDLLLMQVDRLDGNAALQVLDYAPLMDRAVIGEDNLRDAPAATALFRLLSVNNGEVAETATALAAAWRQTPPADLQSVIAAFENDEGLASAIEEYRTGIITLNAIGGLPPKMPSINPEGQDREVVTSDLIKAVQAVRQIPGAADAVDRVVSVIEALGSLAEGDRATLLRQRFAAAIGLLPGVSQIISATNQADADEARQVEGALEEEVG